MRALCLVMLAGLSACGAPDETVEMRQSALQSGVLYSLDCGPARWAFEGECVVFEGPNYTGQCRALGGALIMALSFDEPAARWANGNSFNDNIRSRRCKAHSKAQNPPGAGTCITMMEHVNGSGQTKRVLLGWKGWADMPNEPAPWASAMVMNTTGGSCL